MEENVKTINDFKQILKRRKKDLILTALVIFIIAAGVAFGLPPIYRSTATILIEEQEIPREYAMSMVTSFAEQRIQSYNQRIMSSSRLTEIINRFNLYPDLRQKWALEEVIAKMKKDIRFETITPEVADRRTGKITTATIAFTVSYDGKSPDTVQQVASTLASLYLQENLKVREEKTAGASKFIEEEMKEVQANLASQDRKIAAYKQKHLNSLPELAQLNLQELDRIERNIEQLEINLRSLREREGALQSQLASIAPDLANPDKDRLKELRVKMIFLKNRYSDQYPDVKKTMAEIADLEKKLKISGEEAIGNKPDNPAYITLASQLASMRSEIDSAKRQIAASAERRQQYHSRIVSSPRVEEGYRVLLGERNNLQAKYDDLMKKYMETKVASGMEKGQMGERFTLIDPPRLPEKPVKPNVPAILLIGLVLGIGGGIGTVSLKEYSDQSVRSVEALAKATGVTVLASVPEIFTAKDIARMKRRRSTWAISALLAVIVGIAVFHFFIMDLDVLWAKLARRLPI